MIFNRQYLTTIILPLCVLFVALFSQSDCAAGSRIYIDINNPAGKRLPIAIPDIKGPVGSDSGNKVRDVIVNDLETSGLFNIIDKKSYIEGEKVGDLKNEDPDFRNWITIGADALISGMVISDADEFTVELKLFDVVQAKMLAGRRYSGKAGDLRTIGHRFSNEVLEALTGEKGIFDTKLLFVSAITGAKEVWICDLDGYNVRQITKSNSINLSPQWSPDSRKIIYSSYKEGQPYVYVMDIETGRESKISNYPGINIGARWSPSGKEIAMTLSKDGNPELYILEMDSLNLRRLTNNWAIDVSPTWSPDGKRLAFVSDKGGNPHIYVINSDGTGLARLTFNGKYNAAPAWSPAGDKIAFARLSDGKFNIWVMNPDGTEEVRLTSGSDNESPSWSPDGRYISFTSTRDGGSRIYIMRSGGENQRPVTVWSAYKGNLSTPSWSPLMR